MESTAANESRVPLKQTHRAKIWVWAEVAAWSVCVAVVVWSAASPWHDGSALMVCLGLWGLFRLASAVAILRVDDLSVASSDRREVVAGWLFIARPAANGTFFVSSGILVLAQWHGPFAIVGVVLLAVGLASLVVGVGLLRGWRRKRIAALRVA